MTTPPPNEVTRLLLRWSEGDKDALDNLMSLVYKELHRLARYYMKGERANHTLQASALINEAYMRLADYNNMRWQGRAHFFAVAAQAMRRILVDHARKSKAAKRGDGAYTIALDNAPDLYQQQDVDVLLLDDALTSLSKIDPRMSHIVELRFFSGLTIEETAEALNISAETVRQRWNFAKGWLYREIARGSSDDA